MGTDEKTIPITQNLNLAVFILAGGSIFLFYAQGGFQSIAMNIASGVVGGVVVATILAISKD